MRYVVLFFLTLALCVGLFFGEDFIFKKCGPSNVQALALSLEGLAPTDLDSLTWDIQRNGKAVGGKKFDQNYSQGSEMFVRRYMQPSVNEAGTWDVVVRSGTNEVIKRQFHVQPAGDGCTPITQTWDIVCQKEGDAISCKS